MTTSGLFTEERIRDFFRSHQRVEIIDTGLRRAAVLIPLVVQHSGIEILFTRRTHDVEHHKGQISFPGGVMDPDDASLVDIALRETEEEIGLGPSSVRVLGVCSDFVTPSGFNIAPVVGFIPNLPTLRVHALEVAEVLTVPLPFFLDLSNRRISMETHDGRRRQIVRYWHGSNEIWGATAAILARFIAEISGEGLEQISA